MTVQELLEDLELSDPTAEVRFAAQPNYPIEYSIGQSVEVFNADENKKITYLSEHRQKGYLPKEVSEELGWN